MKKRILAAASACTLTACGDRGSSSAAGDGAVKIAYIVKAKSDEFWTTMEKGAYAYAEEKGVALSFQAPEKETDVEKQVQMVENAVVKGFDAIILSAADSKSLVPAIVKANKANIPVILVNDTIDGDALAAEGGKVETYVGIDQYEAASLAGKYAAENIPNGNIVYLEGVSGRQGARRPSDRLLRSGSELQRRRFSDRKVRPQRGLQRHAERTERKPGRQRCLGSQCGDGPGRNPGY